MTGLPSPTDLAATTPAERDRALDVIRITSLLAVVAGHTIMAVSTIRGDVLIWDNLLTRSAALQALTWIFQIMPLFFFAGAAACLTSWRPGTNWGSWLMTRCTRLFRPVFYYLGFWAVALTALHLVLPQHVYDPIAGVSTQAMWFLGAYVLVLAAMPMLYRITDTARLAVGVGAVYSAMAVVDIVRLHWHSASPLGYLNLTVWLIPAMFGVAYRRQILTARSALSIAAAMFAVNLALVWFGPYQVSMVGTGDHHLSNTSPPSLLMAGHAIVLSLLATAAAPAIGRWARRPRVWWWTALGNSGAMTLYLWHIPALLGIHLLFDELGMPRYPGRPGFAVISIAQVLLMAAAVAVLFVALRPLENNRLPGWDGATPVTSSARDGAIGTLLCIAGATTLAAIHWGLKDIGLDLEAVTIIALMGARALATPVVKLGAPPACGGKPGL
jgi:fucose 4-O-acetylase-like acetyltransferase